MREYRIKVFNNCYKVIYADSAFTEIKEFKNIAHALAYIEKKETPNNGIKELSEAQKRFAAAYPDKVIDCDIPPHVDIDKIITGISESEFLRTQSNITLSSCIKHYDKIIAGGYKDFYKEKDDSGILKHCYTKEQLHDMFTSPEEFEY